MAKLPNFGYIAILVVPFYKIQLIFYSNSWTFAVFGLNLQYRRYSCIGLIPFQQSPSRNILFKICTECGMIRWRQRGRLQTATSYNICWFARSYFTPRLWDMRTAKRASRDVHFLISRRLVTRSCRIGKERSSYVGMAVYFYLTNWKKSILDYTVSLNGYR